MKRLMFMGLMVCSVGLVGCDEETLILVNGLPSGAYSGNGSVDGTERPGSGEPEVEGDQDEENTPQDPGPSVDDRACRPECAESERCVDGQCLPVCIDAYTYCEGECLDLASLHLANCDSCADGYCDSNMNVMDGCDIYVKGSDRNNCGACGQVCPDNQYCSEGACVDTCGADETYCDGMCLKLSDLHLASCHSCADSYCDADGNLANGCEVSAKGNDASHCGSCGNVCGAGMVCDQGTCIVPYESHRMLVVDADELMVRTGPSTNYPDIGSLMTYQYITVLEEKDGWYRHEFGGQMGWSSGKYLLDACDQCEGRKAIDYAEQFLYDSATKLCTWDHLTYSPIIQNFTDLWANYKDYNHGYNDNCANFVTACLKTVGLISKNMINLTQIKNHCTNQTDGYRKINYEDAKAGDIWVNSSGGHTELVIGYKDGTVYLIGSNNFSSSNFTGCQMDTGASGSSYQRVSYASTSKSKTGYICSRQ
ncbi:MAG: SH3 domain-containing protein [Proteobacteria bacterium]|nr:SH3 domain-containing protein [Pseudomonadota bacterium]